MARKDRESRDRSRRSRGRENPREQRLTNNRFSSREKERVPAQQIPAHRKPQGRTRNIAFTNPHASTQPSQQENFRRNPPPRNKETNPQTQKATPSINHRGRGPEATGKLPQERKANSRKQRFLGSAHDQQQRRTFPLRTVAACVIAAILLVGGVSLATHFSTHPLPGGDTGQTSANQDGQNTTENLVAQKLNTIASNIVTISESVNSLQDQGYKMGFATSAITNGANLTYDANRSFYSASSIKGPYILSTIERIGSIPSSLRQDIAKAIESSDNNSYYTVLNNLGAAAINAELASVGASDTLAAHSPYLDITPAQLCGLWKISYPFTTSNSAAAQTLCPYFAETVRSQIKELEVSSTWSKAGWIVESDPHYNATVDAGIVNRDNLVYCMAVMTNKGEDFDAIAPIVQSLDAIEKCFA